MSSRSLAILLNGHRVGTLVQERTGFTTWEPDTTWHAEGQQPRLGISFLRSPGARRRGTGLPSWFENLLPEPDSALRQRICAIHGIRDGQAFALLTAVGHDLAGAVEARPAVPAEDIQKRTRRSERNSSLPMRIATEHLSSLAGMQLKFSMSMVNERLAIPAHGAGGDWIVKFPGRTYENLPSVERATMTWAHRAGFDVPSHFTLKVEDLVDIPSDWVGGVLDAYAVKRFDRTEDGTKIHQEDLCQAFDVAPDRKYGVLPHNAITFDGVLRFVTDVCGEESGREMARRFGFMIASGNGDAHLKNWSLLWGDRTRPTLTPLYDLVTTITWADKLGWSLPRGPALAMKLGGQRRFALVDEEALDRLVATSGQRWAKDELIAGVLRARDAWVEVQALAPPEMASAIQAHWAQVPVLRSVTLPSSASPRVAPRGSSS